MPSAPVMVFSVRREVPDGSAALPVLTLRSLPAHSLSSSMQSLSSGSSPGSLTSSRGSLAASSLDSSTSASFTDLYYDPFEQLDSELQYKVEFLLLEGATGFRPSGCITTIHEDEVAKTQKAEGGSRLQALRSLSGTPKSMTSLSPRSSLSSPSPPCSPLIADPLLAGDAFLSPLGFEDPELSATLCELSLGSSARERFRLEEPGADGKQLGPGREWRSQRVGGSWSLGSGLSSGLSDNYGHHLLTACRAAGLYVVYRFIYSSSRYLLHIYYVLGPGLKVFLWWIHSFNR